MIFDFAEVRCIFEILKILNKGDSKYSIMFKETKFSHSTLQSVLKDLTKKKFIIKQDIDSQRTSYKISGKGEKLLSLLVDLQNIIE